MKKIFLVTYMELFYGEINVELQKGFTSYDKCKSYFNALVNNMDNKLNKQEWEKEDVALNEIRFNKVNHKHDRYHKIKMFECPVEE